MIIVFDKHLWRVCSLAGQRAKEIDALIRSLCNRYVEMEDADTMIQDLTAKVDALNERYPRLSKICLSYQLEPNHGYVEIRYVKSGVVITDIFCEKIRRYGEKS